MSNYGNLNFDDEWEDEPLKKYLRKKKKRDNITDTRLDDLRRALVKSPETSDYQSWDEFLDWQNGQTIDDAWAFLDQMREAGLSENTCREYMAIVSSFLSGLLEKGIVVDSNPAKYVHDEANFEPEEKEWVDRTPNEVGEYLSSIRDPLFQSAATVFAKTGIRRGENYNTDLPHLHIDHPSYYALLEEHDVTIHEKIANRPDSLFIPSEPTIGEEYRGEKRLLGNKRVRATILPLDKETKHSLLNWLAVRPITEYPHPLWTGKKSYQGRERIGKNAFKRRITGDLAEKHGFYSPDTKEKFTLHWFRHFFTTNMKPGFGHHDKHLDPIMIKYLRGDKNTSSRSDNQSGADIMEVYTHDWGDQIRQPYLDNIYQFGIYD